MARRERDRERGGVRKLIVMSRSWRADARSTAPAGGGTGACAAGVAREESTAANQTGPQPALSRRRARADGGRGRPRGAERREEVRQRIETREAPLRTQAWGSYVCVCRPVATGLRWGGVGVQACVHLSFCHGVPLSLHLERGRGGKGAKTVVGQQGRSTHAVR